MGRLPGGTVLQASLPGHPPSRLPVGEDRMGAGGGTFPVSVPWAHVLWSTLNYLFEVGARASFFSRSGSLGWPPLAQILSVEKPGPGLKSGVL